MDINTGKFTAPISGTYMFHAHAEDCNAGESIYIFIRKNRAKMSFARREGDGKSTASTTVVMEVIRGDVINVQTYGCLNGYKGFTVFSGFLL